MNDSQINIAIAEACGIVDVDQWGPLYKTASGWVRDCPDYANDLNAMHEAEKVLTKTKLQTYLDFLADAPRDHVHKTWTTSVFATARQRAEAFLKTIGKWEEVQQ